MIKLSSRLDAVVMRMESMLKQKPVTKMLETVSKDLDPMINNNTLTKMSVVMDKFEQQFVDLDIQSKVMESAIGLFIFLHIKFVILYMLVEFLYFRY